MIPGAGFWRRTLVGAAERTSGSPRASDAVVLAALGGALRLGTVVWGASKFPLAADGQFYDTVARRIAEGNGYTWLWPDGAVTFAAHYPVGYPAIIGVLYALFGQAPLWAMLFNAVLGTLAVFASYWVAADVAGRRSALLGGLGVALHPSLALYTPALMTEGVTAALYVIAAWVALEAGRRVGLSRVFALGLVLGIGTLIRPQTLLLAPLFGAAAHWRARDAEAGAGSRTRGPLTSSFWFRSLLTTLLSIVVCLPWTLRNCEKMGSCVFVSANGGWNLLIGTEPKARGAWIALTEMGVPAECREVFEEAAKDSCFGRAALARIQADPVGWLALVPKKWSATFDYPGAPSHYFRMSNPVAFDHDAEQRLLAVETVWQRLLLALGLFGFARVAGKRHKLRWILGVLGVVSLLTPLGFPAVLALLASAALLGRELWGQPALVMSIGVVLATLLMHALFFGAGRYCLVCGYVAGVLAGAAVWTSRGASPPSRPSAGSIRPVLARA